MISYVQAFALTIHTGTDAFKPDPSPELARILREIADQIEAGRDPRQVGPGPRYQRQRCRQFHAG